MLHNSCEAAAWSGGHNWVNKDNRKSDKVRKLTAREVALDVLTAVEQDKAYSNLLLNQALQKHHLERADAGLATEIVYGTIQRLNTIDYYLGTLVSKGLGKLQPWVRSLLRLSFYQLHYLDRVPDHAVVSEAVNIAKRRGHSGIFGMVNAVLRNAIRRKDQWQLPQELPLAERIALQHSHPIWLVERWLRQLGAERTERICEANNVPPHVSIRTNPLKNSREELLRLLEESGHVDAAPSPLAPAGVIVNGGGNMALTPGYAEGLFTIQDESSMLVAEALAPAAGMTVLDCCAAPGGKTTHIAELMGDEGVINACDIHEHKKQLIDAAATRLNLSSIRTMVADARELSKEFDAESFDRILLDAPCSGFGVIRRKPDLKWVKSEAEIKAIIKIQRELLEEVNTLLRPGGTLIYSTCTIEKEENEGNVMNFLQKHPEFELAPIVITGLPATLAESAQAGMLQIDPDEFHSDGFFIAKLRKK